MSARTLEAWAQALIETPCLGSKLEPGPLPHALDESWRARRIEAPGRPPELRVAAKSPKSPRGLAPAQARAQLLHTFFHHELQAAELFAWALLAWPHTPPAFRRGLGRLAQEELAHARLYAARLEELGHPVGSFPVRDWFWERVPTCRDEVEFVALVGMGFEAGNLDHCERFAARLRAVGDEPSARLTERVGREEEAHVRFALHWFVEWTGGQDFERWLHSLPEPLTPLVLRGAALDRRARERAGQEAAFLDALAAWQP